MRAELTSREFWTRISVSAVFSAAGFSVVLFGLGDPATARLAAGWLGGILGYWLR